MNEEMLELLRNINRNLEILTAAQLPKKARERMMPPLVGRGKVKAISKPSPPHHRRQVREILAARNGERVLPASITKSFNRMAASINEWGG